MPTVNTKILIEKFSNYEKLLEESKIKSHVGLFFPCFNEFSRKAAIESFRLLPNYFVFSGGIDTTSALISHPNLLIRKDGYAPLYGLVHLIVRERTLHTILKVMAIILPLIERFILISVQNLGFLE